MAAPGNTLSIIVYSAEPNEKLVKLGFSEQTAEEGRIGYFMETPVYLLPVLLRDLHRAGFRELDCQISLSNLTPADLTRSDHVLTWGMQPRGLK